MGSFSLNKPSGYNYFIIFFIYYSEYLDLLLISGLLKLDLLYRTYPP